MNNNQLKLMMSALILILFMVSCGKKKKSTTEDDGRPTVQVEILEAGGAHQEGYFSMSGKIQAEKSVRIASQIMGPITSAPVKVGDQVIAGQTLAVLSSSNIRAKSAQAQAGILEAQTALNNLDKDYNRIKNLFDKGSATRKELDDISSGKEIMQAKLSQAREAKNEIDVMLSYSVIKAPFNGVITEKLINQGDLANPGNPLFILESGSNFQAVAMIPENHFSSVQKGDPAKVVIKSSGKELDGVISEISQSSLNTGGLYSVKVDLDKDSTKDIQLFSGMYLTVLFEDKESVNESKAVFANKNAIVKQGQLSGIYTVSDQNTAILRWVRLGKESGGQVEILSGLSAGEKYVSDYEGRLMNGVKLELK